MVAATPPCGPASPRGLACRTAGSEISSRPGHRQRHRHRQPTEVSVWPIPSNDQARKLVLGGAASRGSTWAPELLGLGVSGIRWLGSAGAKATEQDRDSKYGDEDAGAARCLPSVHDDGDESEDADVGEGEEQSEDGVLVGVHPDIMVKRAKATASRARSDDVPCAAATSGDLSPPGEAVTS